jgi:hypothetical protein
MTKGETLQKLLELQERVLKQPFEITVDGKGFPAWDYHTNSEYLSLLEQYYETSGGGGDFGKLDEQAVEKALGVVHRSWGEEAREEIVKQKKIIERLKTKEFIKL